MRLIAIRSMITIFIQYMLFTSRLVSLIARLCERLENYTVANFLEFIGSSHSNDTRYDRI